MKKKANILNYVEKYKNKYGISYADAKGKLVKTLTVILNAVWIYSFFWTAFFILSTTLNISAGLVDFSYIANDFITICVGAVVMIVALVLMCLKQKIAAAITVIIPQPFMMFSFGRFCESIDGIFGYISKFYWCHFIPAVILVILAVWLIVILIRAKVKTNKIYNMLVEGLYAQYGKKDGEKLTEAEWDEFLSEYNPYKPLV